MPELSRFYNIIIQMFFSDTEKHSKPHFHAKYNEYSATIDLNGELLAGSLPVKQLKLVEAWVILHEEELKSAWNKSVKNENPSKIDPLI